MTDGGIGSGLSYWATIRIEGNLDKDELNGLIKNIKALLKKPVGSKIVTGEIVAAARLSNAGPPVSIALKKPPNKSGQ